MYRLSKREQILLRKLCTVVLSIGMLLGILQLSIPVRAANAKEPTFSFALSADGETVKEASYGDIIAVTLQLQRTDADTPYTMYAMQDEIRYDSTFFKLVEDGTTLTSGITSTDIASTDEFREYYMNYLSMNGGAQWNASTQIGTIHLKVIGKSGAAKITNEDYLVSTKDGSGSYPCKANDVTVVVSTECTVKFETRGGNEIAPQTVQYGEFIVRPDDPKRNGYEFDGWYSDIDLTEQWDFETDPVQRNMTLYAKWAKEAPKPDHGTWPKHMGLYLCAVLLLLLLVIVLLLKRKRKQTEEGEPK